MPSIFDTDEFKPYAARWQSRAQEFARRRGYKTGQCYSGVRSQLSWLGPRLASSIRPLYLPVGRAVQLDSALVPGGWRLAEQSAALAPAVQRVLVMSKWSTRGVLYNYYGAMLGEVGLKVCDDRAENEIEIRALSPETFMLFGSDTYDDLTALVLIVENRFDRGETFEYAEAITADSIRTFRDGKPFSFAGRGAAYPNLLGFVPLVSVRHIESGAALGDCTFQDIIPLLDEVNKLASDLAELITKHKEPQWAVIGVEDGDLKRSGDNVWFIPPVGGDAKALVAPIDVNGVLSFIREIASNVHAGLAELAYDEMRTQNQIATASIELQLSELKAKIDLIRPNYDAGLAAALRMAGRAGKSMKLLELAKLDDDALAFDPLRRVLPLSEKQLLELDMLRAQIVVEQGKALGRAKM